MRIHDVVFLFSLLTIIFLTPPGVVLLFTGHQTGFVMLLIASSAVYPAIAAFIIELKTNWK